MYLFTRDSDGKRNIVRDSSFEPYFFVREGDSISDLRVRRIEHHPTYVDIMGTALSKVVVDLPSSVPDLREKVEKSWEADIQFPVRYMIDAVDAIEPTTPRVLFLDIETDTTSRIPSVSTVPMPIICVGLHDSQENSYTTFVYRNDLMPGKNYREYDGTVHEVVYCRTEEDLLQGLVKFIHDMEPDIISGWNLNRFDMLYLLNRLERLRIDYQALSPIGDVYIKEYRDPVIKGVALIDLYDAYRHLVPNLEESYQLGYISKKVTGQLKGDLGSNMHWSWVNHLDDVIDYCTNDVRITKLIDDKLRLLDFMNEIRTMAYCQFEDTLSASKTCDSFILRMFHGRKIFPTKLRHEKVEFKGAFTGSWTTGIHTDVIAFDLKSLYPSILTVFNLSPDTMSDTETGFEVDGIYIDRSRIGYLTEVINKLFEERTKYKALMQGEVVKSDKWNFYDARQYAIKILLNSVYGQTAYVNSRIYDPRVAKTITYLGRQIIHWSKEVLETLGFSVLYVDTDSLMWSMNDGLDIDMVKAMQGILNNSYDDFIAQYGLHEHRFEMEFQKVYKRAFFGKAKKRYAGSVMWQDGQAVDFLEIVGFETRRSDAAHLSKKIQETVFDMLLRQGKAKDEVLRYVGDEIDRFRNGKYTIEEIGMPRGITRELSDYARPSANIRGALYTTNVLKHELSNKPKLIYITQMPNGYVETDVLCFDDEKQVPSGVQVNIELMLEKLVKNKLESIFDAMGWKISELVYYWKGKAPKRGEQLTLFSRDL